MHELSRERTQELLANVQGKEIAVIGDVMLDRYFWGAVSRVSPEAPVPVVDVESETIHLGGAANVAANLQALGALPVLCGVIGDDSTGKMITMLANEAGMNTSGLVVSNDRPTTVKTRVIGNNQQIVRLDRETRADVQHDVVEAVRSLIATRQTLSAVILEDYNKGLLTEALITAVIDAAAVRGIPVFVDPKRSNFFAYRRSYVFKPNRKEATDALGYSLRSDEDVVRAGTELLRRLECDNVLITLGAAGMMLFERSGTVSSVPTIAKNVADVSGAGDTAIATLAALSTAGANIREAATLANIASGIVVEEPGIVSITAERLLASIT